MADQHIRSWFGVQYLARGHFDMQTSRIEPATDYKMLVLPLSHSCPSSTFTHRQFCS